MTALRAETRALEKRMEDGFTAARTEMGSLEKRMDEKLSALEIRERLAALEAKVASR